MKSFVAVRKPVGTPIANDCSSVNIASGSYTQLSSSLGAAVSAIVAFNTSAKAIKLAIGGAGSEVDQIIIPPSTLGMLIPVEWAKTARLSAKALGADATTGFLVVNFLA